MQPWIFYLIIFLIVLMFVLSVLTARWRMKRVYLKYMNTPIAINITGKQFAFACKELLGLQELKFSLSQGTLTDAYISKHKTLVLSEKVCNTASLSSIAIVAHELGHALQDKNKSFIFHLSRFIKKLVAFTNKFIIPALIASFFIYAANGWESELALTFLYIAAILFTLHIFSNLLLLPIEYGASSTALRILKTYNVLTPKELEKARYLLNVAAKTYIAHFFDDMFSFGRKGKY